VINHHFSYVHASFWLGIVQCSNRRRFLVPDESGPRFAWHTYQKPATEKMESIFGADIWSMCIKMHIVLVLLIYYYSYYYYDSHSLTAHQSPLLPGCIRARPWLFVGGRPETRIPWSSTRPTTADQDHLHRHSRLCANLRVSVGGSGMERVRGLCGGA